MKKFRSSSSAETKRFAEGFAQKFLKPSPNKKGAFVLALQGDLGAGKTTFTQGFAKGLGIKRRLTSPTFVIMRRYRNFYHIDAYRLKKSAALEILGFKKILNDPAAVILIEWPENVKKILPRKTIWLTFRYGKKENEREIGIL